MVRSDFAWRRWRRAALRSSRNASTRACRPAPSASRSMRCATVRSRESHARNLFRRAPSESASCAETVSANSSTIGSPRSGAAAAPTQGSPAIARRVRGEHLAVGGKHVAPRAMHVDLGDHPDQHIGVLGRGVQQRAIGLGQRRPPQKQRTPPPSAHRRVPAPSTRRTCAAEAVRAARRPPPSPRPATARSPTPRRGG